MRMLLFFLLMTVSLISSATDSFYDGDFTNNPTWTGNTGSWQIVSNSDAGPGAIDSRTLRLNAAAAGTFYLSTQNITTLGEGTVWEYFVGRRAQAFTASNYILIWLWASEADLTSPTIDGYRIRIGDDVGDDEIVLQRVNDGVATDILVGPGIANGLTDIGFLLRVDYEETQGWYLYTSPLPTANGTGAVATDFVGIAETFHGNVIDIPGPLFPNGYIGFTVVTTGSANARTAQEFDRIGTTTTLPVKLVRFNAVKEGNGVHLDWDVAEESNVQAYEVQRSENGIQFSTIGSVNAEGKRNYSFTDNHAGVDNRFYRLRIVDLDGKIRLSHIVSIKSRSGIGFRASPNPVTTTLHVQHPKVLREARLQVVTVEGRVVKQVIIPENAVLSPVNVSGLRSGVYYVVFVSGNERIAERIIKQ